MLPPTGGIQPSLFNNHNTGYICAGAHTPRFSYRPSIQLSTSTKLKIPRNQNGGEDMAKNEWQISAFYRQCLLLHCLDL